MTSSDGVLIAAAELLIIEALGLEEHLQGFPAGQVADIGRDSALIQSLNDIEFKLCLLADLFKE